MKNRISLLTIIGLFLLLQLPGNVFASYDVPCSYPATVSGSEYTDYTLLGSTSGYINAILYNRNTSNALGVDNSPYVWVCGGTVIVYHECTDFKNCSSIESVITYGNCVAYAFPLTYNSQNIPAYNNPSSIVFPVHPYLAFLPQLTVTLNPQTGGTVTSDPASDFSCSNGTCTGHFSGDVTLTETAADGWTFSNWFEGCNGYSSTQYTVSMTGNKEIKAVFKLLSFPLHNDCDGSLCTPYTEPVSSVFDHTATAEYENDSSHHVTAFNGESSDDSTFYSGTTCYAKDSNHNTAFGAEFNYLGVSGAGVYYLCYDGHPGYDYPVAIGTDVYPAASGTVITIVSGETEENKQTPGGNYVEIEHTGGYKTKYLHLHSVDATNVQLNQTIQPNVRLGTSGCTGTWCSGPHLHFQVDQVINGDNVPVDPYGWEGSGNDPYTRAINYNLWK